MNVYLSRRGFLRSGLSSTVIAISGCGLPAQKQKQFIANCLSAPQDDNTLRIDMHCHLMNGKDSNEAAFVTRRFLRNATRNRRTQENDRAKLIAFIRSILAPDYKSARTEANNLRGSDPNRNNKPGTFLTENGKGPKTVCHLGLPRKYEILASDDGTSKPHNHVLGDGRLTGFVSARTRNAAMLMAQFPKIDLFLPSIVDFYEADPESYSDPERQMQFYTALAIATEGRFLPVVSFHPERYFDEIKDRHALTNLDLVRGSIEHAGAVAVKVHPSSGFDPFDNARYAQLTGDTRKTCRDPREDYEDHKWRIMDDGMRALYALCDELDVPILTHSGLSIASRPTCMEYSPNPDNWTNSTHHWAQALDHAHRAGNVKARVALAHFAGGFGQMKPALSDKRKTPNQFPKGTPLTPTKWLETAMKHMRRGRHDMYLDTSIMNELALSRAHLENRTFPYSQENPKWTFNTQFNPMTREVFEEAKTDNGEFAEKFDAFFRDHKELHSRTMYGSDWHMPNTSSVSGHDGFMRLIESAIPDEKGLRANVMGKNAARFYGLREGQPNRKRIDRFLSQAGVDLRHVRWRHKLDNPSS